eukprot:scaffold8828_cov204-Amphora_coffeaeformis.AAC.24
MTPAFGNVVDAEILKTGWAKREFVSQKMSNLFLPGESMVSCQSKRSQEEATSLLKLQQTRPTSHNFHGHRQRQWFLIASSSSTTTLASP